jgi:hypothetical protein
MRDAEKLSFEAGAGCGGVILLSKKWGADLKELAYMYQERVVGMFTSKIRRGFPETLSTE